jgi:preprotein translocase subunit SecA
MLDRVRDDVVRVLMTVRIQTQEEIEQAELEAARAVQMQNVQYQHTDYDAAPAEESQAASRALAEDHPGTLRNAAPKVGRNDPCPCGSGKKYKHCHGQLT